MDSAQWTQEFGVAKSMGTRAITMERKGRPQKEEAVNCPRCHSTNTKFCYYNNYSLTQPRYFCKTCRRYWTEGGTLRNVPVGGGSRKNKRYAATSLIDPNPPPLLTINSQNPKIQDIQGHDLNLGFHDLNVMHASSSTSSNLNFLRAGFNSFMPAMGDQTSNVNNIYASAGFPFQECKPFQVDDDVVSNGYGNPNLDSSSSSLMRFALGSAAGNNKRNTTTTHEGGDDIHQDKAAPAPAPAASGQQNSNGFWNIGMLGGTSAPNW